MTDTLPLESETFGSGKLGSPWFRMHLENANAELAKPFGGWFWALEVVVVGDVDPHPDAAATARTARASLITRAGGTRVGRGGGIVTGASFSGGLTGWMQPL